jgi:hypothetical protein
LLYLYKWELGLYIILHLLSPNIQNIFHVQTKLVSEVCYNLKSAGINWNYTTTWKNPNLRYCSGKWEFQEPERPGLFKKKKKMFCQDFDEVREWS